MKRITKVKNRNVKMNYTKQKEVWKTYPRYSFIEASSLGRIRTKDRFVTRSNGGKYFVKGRVLKQWDNGQGYLYVRFRLNGKPVHLYVHRIVATCFIANPLDLPQVNHKDNNPKNNVASNLEWCTTQYNTAYKEKYGKSAAEVFGRPVFAVNLDTGKVFYFKTQSECARQLGVNVGHMNEVVKEKLKKTGGYWFCYADKNAIEKVRSKFGDEIVKKVKELISDNL